MTPYERADRARLALASAYRARADRLNGEALMLEHLTLEELARRPVPYRDRGCRAEEEALDAALMAL